MAMGAGLIDATRTASATRWPGCLGLVTSYEKRKMHLGYRSAVLRQSILRRAMAIGSASAGP